MSSSPYSGLVQNITLSLCKTVRVLIAWLVCSSSWFHLRPSVSRLFNFCTQAQDWCFPFAFYWLPACDIAQDQTWILCMRPHACKCPWMGILIKSEPLKALASLQILPQLRFTPDHDLYVVVSNLNSSKWISIWKQSQRMQIFFILRHTWRGNWVCLPPVLPKKTSVLGLSRAQKDV